MLLSPQADTKLSCDYWRDVNDAAGDVSAVESDLSKDHNPKDTSPACSSNSRMVGNARCCETYVPDAHLNEDDKSDSKDFSDDDVSQGMDLFKLQSISSPYLRSNPRLIRLPTARALIFEEDVAGAED